MAVNKYEVTSVADCFHFKYAINKLLNLSLVSKLKKVKNNFEKINKQETENKEVINQANSKNETEKHEVNSQKTDKQNEEQVQQKAEQYAQVQFNIDLYVDSMGNISHVLHPYQKGVYPNTGGQAEININTELSKIEQIIVDCEIKDKYNLFAKAQNQVKDVISVIPLWHNFVDEQVRLMNLKDDVKYWFENYLLPKTYWMQALQKTKYKPIKERLKKELLFCEQNKIPTPELSNEDCHKLEEKALYLSRKFQRASSQVEGRNGFLSLINHNQKSFDHIRLEVMTVIHNYDTRGIDGKTPAERLFGDKMKFEPLFDYILDNFGELPRPKKRIVSG